MNELDDTLVKINVQVGKIEKEIKAELKKKKGGNGGEEKGTGGEEEGKKANSIGIFVFIFEHILLYRNTP